jgi:hypothetical protein
MIFLCVILSRGEVPIPVRVKADPGWTLAQLEQETVAFLVRNKVVDPVPLPHSVALQSRAGEFMLCRDDRVGDWFVQGDAFRFAPAPWPRVAQPSSSVETPFLSKGTLLLFPHHGGHLIPGVLGRDVAGGPHSSVEFTPFGSHQSSRPLAAVRLKAKLGQCAVPGPDAAISHAALEFAATPKGSEVMAAWSAFLQARDQGDAFVCSQLEDHANRKRALQERVERGKRKRNQVELGRRLGQMQPLVTEMIQVGDLLIAGDMDVNDEIIAHANETCVIPRGHKIARGRVFGGKKKD